MSRPSIRTSRPELARKPSTGLGWPWYVDVLWQLFLVNCAFAIYAVHYLVLRRLYPGAAWGRAAIADSDRVVQIERSIGIFSEPSFQRLASSHATFVHGLNLVYIWANVPLVIVLAIWMYVWRHHEFVLMRNAMLASTCIALLCELLPFAPPYLVPGLGMFNTAQGLPALNFAEPHMFFDPYAALPSVHIAWIVLTGTAIWRTFGAFRLRWLGPALPILMVVAVVATGNHFYLDIVTGAMTGLISLAIGMLLLRIPRAGRALVPLADPMPDVEKIGMERFAGDD